MLVIFHANPLPLPRKKVEYEITNHVNTIVISRLMPKELLLFISKNFKVVDEPTVDSPVICESQMLALYVSQLEKHNS